MYLVKNLFAKVIRSFARALLPRTNSNSRKVVKQNAFPFPSNVNRIQLLLMRKIIGNARTGGRSGKKLPSAGGQKTTAARRFICHDVTAVTSGGVCVCSLWRLAAASSVENFYQTCTYSVCVCVLVSIWKQTVCEIVVEWKRNWVIKMLGSKVIATVFYASVIFNWEL